MNLHTLLVDLLSFIVVLTPGTVTALCGYYFGRRSRDAEVHGYKLSMKFLEFLATYNASIADKVLREISRKGNQ